MTLEATGNLTKDAETGGTKLVDAHNGFNDLSRLAIFCMVLHRWRTGVRFTFNCYMHWAQILPLQPGHAPVILLIRDWVTQGDSLLMVLYGNTLFPLGEEIMDADPNLLSPFYARNTTFDGS